MAWDYGIRKTNDITNGIFVDDIYIDSTGDIAIVGNCNDDSQDVEVVAQDILTGVYANQVYILQNNSDIPEITERAIESLFDNDTRLKSISATVLEDGSIYISFTLKNGQTGEVTA